MKKYFFFLFILFGLILFTLLGKSAYEPFLVNLFSKKSELLSEANTDERVQHILNEAGFAKSPTKITIVGLKKEQILQVYGTDDHGRRLIKEYPFTRFCGYLGPKLEQGDKQIPEGIYKIEYLNPNSSYHLSMKINYPNEFDRSKSKFSILSRMGGDIFIHGSNQTIGCIPIGNTAIEEVYQMVENAMDNEISVIISPLDFRKSMEYPSIYGIDWEGELYDSISSALQLIP